MALEHLGYRAHTEEEVRGRGAKAVAVPEPRHLRRFSASPPSARIWRGSSPASSSPLIVSEHLEPVYRDLEMPLVPVLADIERAGVLVDCPLLAAQSRHLEQELASFTARIYELAGEEFNINSPVAARAHPVREAGAAGRQEDGQDAIGFDRRRSARGAGARSRTPPAGPRVARRCRS